MKISQTVLLFSLLFVSSRTFAQSSIDSQKKWGLETELVQPFIPTVGIIRVTGTHTITSSERKMKGDLLFGLYLRPNVEHDVVEKINEYMLVLGYRHFFWKGLHLEAKSNMGYAWGSKNLIDGRDYETPTWFWEANAGYKFNLTNGTKSNIYITPQIGGLGKIIADIGPRGGKPDNFLHANLLIGINF